MENFSSLVEQLLRNPASVVQVPNDEILLLVLQQLLTDPSSRQELGERAQSALRNHAGATQRTVTHLLGPA
jgi:3-deoxy-D-manno-octulosonic-acid transferase